MGTELFRRRTGRRAFSQIEKKSEPIKESENRGRRERNRQIEQDQSGFARHWFAGSSTQCFTEGKHPNIRQTIIVRTGGSAAVRTEAVIMILRHEAFVTERRRVLDGCSHSLIPWIGSARARRHPTEQSPAEDCNNPHCDEEHGLAFGNHRASVGCVKSCNQQAVAIARSWKVRSKSDGTDLWLFAARADPGRVARPRGPLGGESPEGNSSQWTTRSSRR